MHGFPLAAAGKLTVEPVTLLTVEPVEQTLETQKKAKKMKKGEKPRSNVGEMRGFHSTGKSSGVVSKSVPGSILIYKNPKSFFQDQ